MAGMIDRQEAHIAFAWNTETRSPIAMIGWRIANIGGRRVADILWLAGADLKLWLPLIPQGERFFKEHERCDRVRAFGRKGWERLMRLHGYRNVSTVVEKELN